eukprot:7772202-Pyramimonas_sp.AAC.1
MITPSPGLDPATFGAASGPAIGCDSPCSPSRTSPASCLRTFLPAAAAHPALPAPLLQAARRPGALAARG